MEIFRPGQQTSILRLLTATLAAGVATAAPLPTISPWSLLATGDFARSAAHAAQPLAMGALPGGRRIYFLSSPSLVVEATIARSADFRDRQDADAGRPGVVGATGQAWSRRRDKLRVLQTRTILESTAPAAVAAAVSHATDVCALDASSALTTLSVDELLRYCSTIIRYALHQIVIGTQPPPTQLPPKLAQVGRRPRRHGVSSAWLGPLARLGQWLLQQVAAVSLLGEQAWALLRGTSFFELAQLYTSRARKVSRRAARYSAACGAAVERLAAMMGAAGPRWCQPPQSPQPASASVDWVEAVVGARWEGCSLPHQVHHAGTRSAVGGVDGIDGGGEVDGGGGVDGGSGPPTSLLDALMAPSAEHGDSVTRLEKEEVADVVRDVLVAGGETTSETLVAAVMLLRERPDVAATVAEEARARLSTASVAVTEDNYRSTATSSSAATAAAAAAAAAAAPNAPTDFTAFIAAAAATAPTAFTAAAAAADARVAAFSAAAAPSSLPWSRACLLEASRLHPAAPLLLRVALRDTTLGDVPIPQGSALVASTALLGRDAAVWEAPNAFMPERFVDGHEPQERGAQAARAQLASFGSGPRSCVGQQLALTLASLTLAHMMAASVSPASPND
jgi:hypothetical protein